MQNCVWCVQTRSILQETKSSSEDVHKPTVRMPQNVAVPGLAIANTKEYAKQQYSKMLEEANAAVTQSSGQVTGHSTQDRHSPDHLNSRGGGHRDGGARDQRRSRDSRRDRPAADTQRNKDAHSERIPMNRAHGDGRPRSDEYGGRDGYRCSGRDDTRRSTSVDSRGRGGRSTHRDRGRSPYGGERTGDRRERADLPETPDVSAVYKGTVKNTARHGAYVELAGFRGRVEGMVHISNLSNRRVGDVTEVCKRGDEVWVKVLSIQPPQPGQARARIDLSLRDVDQGTGKDLLPVHDTALHPIGVP